MVEMLWFYMHNVYQSPLSSTRNSLFLLLWFRYQLVNPKHLTHVGVVLISLPRTSQVAWCPVSLLIAGAPKGALGLRWEGQDPKLRVLSLLWYPCHTPALHLEKATVITCSSSIQECRGTIWKVKSKISFRCTIVPASQRRGKLRVAFTHDFLISSL